MLWQKENIFSHLKYIGRSSFDADYYWNEDSVSELEKLPEDNLIDIINLLCNWNSFLQQGIKYLHALCINKILLGLSCNSCLLSTAKKTQLSLAVEMNQPCVSIYFLIVSILALPVEQTKYPSLQNVRFLQK
jgi:hypothetical protein